MSYFEKIGIYGTDSPSIDAFARLRVSAPFTQFDNKLLSSSSMELYWSDRTWGNATASYAVYESAENLSVDTTSGSRAVSQTKQRFTYEPGKSLLVVKTGVFGIGIPGVIKYIAYGDDYYGVGFCQSGSSFGVYKRTTVNSASTVTTFVSQSNWNIDKFDGTGPSRKFLNITASQIFFEDIEWLGVGRVRYGIFQGGLPYYVHEFAHVNELANVYTGNPNLPVRYELVNSIGSATTASLKHICASVVSEGGSNNPGIFRTIDTTTRSILLPTSSHLALLMLRSQTGSAANGWREGLTKIYPTAFDVLQLGNNETMWSVLLNPIIPNSSSLNWQRASEFSAEFATGSSTTTISDRGRVVASGYILANTAGTKIAQQNLSIDAFYSLGIDLFGNRDVFALAIWNLSNTVTGSVYASMTFKEVL